MPEPTQQRPEIPEPISTGAAPFYVLVVSDDYPSVGGQPVVLKHRVSETTLSAVLRRRAPLGSKYGRTFIAECRIIPELTSEGTADA